MDNGFDSCRGGSAAPTDGVYAQQTALFHQQPHQFQQGGADLLFLHHEL